MKILEPNASFEAFCLSPFVQSAMQSRSCVIGSVDVDAHVSKKNSRPIFRRGAHFAIGKSQRLVSAEITLEEHFGNLVRMGCHTFSEPVAVTFWFEFDRAWAITKRTKELRKTMPDLSNLYELPQDCMQAAGLLKNDGLIRSHDGSRIVIGDAHRLHYCISHFIEG